jgi:ribosome-binding factor A
MRKKSIPGRQLRIADQIQRDLSELIRHELKNEPNAVWVTLQSVELTADYAHAKVYFTLIQGDPLVMQATLNQAAGRLHAALFKRLHIHTVPSLRFVFDTTLEKAAHMSRLIEEANAKRARD